MSGTAGLIIIATATAVPGMEAKLEAALREAAGPTLEQPGCLGFEFLRSREDPATITAIERWETDADHDRHLQGAHIARLMARFDGVLTKPPSIVPMSPLG